MNEKASRLYCILGLVGICLMIASCSSNRDRINALQDTVDRFSALTRHLRVPERFLDGDFTRMESDFDVNTYFTVLDHLSMEPGYVLDYVYYLEDIGGNPVLYARPSDQLPYADLTVLVGAEGEWHQTSFISSRHGTNYLEHIVVDDTAEGYFQLAILNVLGEQFYLFWHGNYYDYMIVCNQDGLDAVFEEVDPTGSGVDIPADFRPEAERLDLEPIIELREDVAVVRFVTFTKWGGFEEIVYTISREFPHRILEWEVETLLEYDWGMSL